MSYVSRYLAGEREQVWTELATLGEEVRSTDVLEDAHAVAAETMRRVAHNLEILQERLPVCGYRFGAPSLKPPRAVYRPAGAVDLALLARFERENGPLPLSLHAFYSLIGEADLAQDYEQLVQWPEREEGTPYTELEMLGEYGPLSVSSLAFLLNHRQPNANGVSLPLLPDEAGNAYYSGDYYYATLPNPHSDAILGTWSGVPHSFVDYLRQAFQYSGFHGMPNAGQKPESGDWLFPTLPCITSIAADLLPI